MATLTPHERASMLREADALLADPHAFNPPHSLDTDRGFRVLNGVCWVALFVITIGFTILLWRIK